MTGCLWHVCRVEEVKKATQLVHPHSTPVRPAVITFQRNVLSTVLLRVCFSPAPF